MIAPATSYEPTLFTCRVSPLFLAGFVRSLFLIYTLCSSSRSRISRILASPLPSTSTLTRVCLIAADLIWKQQSETNRSCVSAIACTLSILLQSSTSPDRVTWHCIIADLSFSKEHTELRKPSSVDQLTLSLFYYEPPNSTPMAHSDWVLAFPLDV